MKYIMAAALVVGSMNIAALPSAYAANAVGVKAGATTNGNTNGTSANANAAAAGKKTNARASSCYLKNTRKHHKEYLKCNH